MFLMVEMDSTPSKTSRESKILKIDNFNLDFQKSLPDFIKILPEFYDFQGKKASLPDFIKIFPEIL